MQNDVKSNPTASKRKAKDSESTVRNSNAEEFPVKKSRTVKSKGKRKADLEISWPEDFLSVSTSIASVD
jgi:hypothetical protein